MDTNTPRVALVTGAQQGIGRASALALAEHGYDIAVHYLDDRSAAESLAAEIAAMGRRASLHQADLSQVSAALALVDEAFVSQGRLDAVVNNAGIFHRASFAGLSENLWNITLEINLRTAVFVTQAAVAIMRRTSTAGAIVNVSSVASFGTANGVHYSASKGGMDGMTRAVALDVARDNIRINGVAPGMIMTAQALEGHSREDLHAIAAATVPGRMGSAEEVASVVAFLLSDASSFINGEVIQVNGGAHMS